MATGTLELLRTLKVEPEFRDKIPPLTDAEYEQLRENILDAGEVYHPICVWNGIVIDGHNRLKVVQENPNIKWQTRDMDFVDKWAAFDWMYRNQLGRRNLTDAQRTFMIGKMYEARKKSHGGDRRSNEFSRDQNGLLNERRRVYEQIADELGVSDNTVKRSEKFANGIDAIKQISPEAADAILTEKIKFDKKYIRDVADAEPELQQQVAVAIEMGEVLPAMTIKKPTRRKPSETEKTTPTTEDLSSEKLPENQNDTKAYSGDTKTREIYRSLDKAYAPMLDVNTKSNYNLEDLSIEIKEAGEMFVNSFLGTLNDREYLLSNDTAWDVVKAAIEDVIKNIQDGLTRMKGEMTK